MAKESVVDNQRVLGYQLEYHRKPHHVMSDGFLLKMTLVNLLYSKTVGSPDTELFDF